MNQAVTKVVFVVSTLSTLIPVPRARAGRKFGLIDDVALGADGELVTLWSNDLYQVMSI